MANYETVFKDYSFSKDTGVLLKLNVIEKKHLMWKDGGIPYIDKGVWDKHKPNGVFMFTDKNRVFFATKADFVDKKEVDYGFGVQYCIPKERWHVEEHKDKKSAMASFMKFEKNIVANNEPVDFEFVMESLKDEYQKQPYEKEMPTVKEVNFTAEERKRKIQIMKDAYEKAQSHQKTPNQEV